MIPDTKLARYMRRAGEYHSSLGYQIARWWRIKIAVEQVIDDTGRN